MTAIAYNALPKTARIKTVTGTGGNVNELVCCHIFVTASDDTIAGTITCNTASDASLTTPFPMKAEAASITCVSAACALASTYLPYAIPADSTTYGIGYAVTYGNLTATKVYLVEIWGTPLSVTTGA